MNYNQSLVSVVCIVICIEYHVRLGFVRYERGIHSLIGQVFAWWRVVGSRPSTPQPIASCSNHADRRHLQKRTHNSMYQIILYRLGSHHGLTGCNRQIWLQKNLKYYLYVHMYNYFPYFTSEGVNLPGNVAGRRETTPTLEQGINSIDPPHIQT